MTSPQPRLQATLTSCTPPEACWGPSQRTSLGNLDYAVIPLEKKKDVEMTNLASLNALADHCKGVILPNDLPTTQNDKRSDRNHSLDSPAGLNCCCHAGGIPPTF